MMTFWQYISEMRIGSGNRRVIAVVRPASPANPDKPPKQKKIPVQKMVGN